MNKVITFWSKLIIVLLAFVYSYLIVIYVNHNTAGMTDYELIAHNLYSQIYINYFIVSTGILILTFVYQLKINNMSFEKVYDNTTYLKSLLAVFIVGSQIVFIYNLKINEYSNTIPAYTLILIIILTIRVGSSIYVNEKFFISGNNIFYFEDIVAADFSDPLKIKVQYKEKDYYIFCSKNKKHEFIKNIIELKV